MMFCIATFVNNEKEYDAMRSSFEAAGFTAANTRFNPLDNTTGNRYEPYSGLNAVLAEATEPYVIACHQDVRAIESIDRLTAAIDALNANDPHWAVAGNAGYARNGRFIRHLCDPSRRDEDAGRGPVPVLSLDENFLVLRRNAGVRFSETISGFHLYGSDICLCARILRKNTYVIPYLVEHLSLGNPFTPEFKTARTQFISCWSRFFWLAYYQAPCTACALCRIRLLGRLLNHSRIVSWVSNDPARYYHFVERRIGAFGPRTLTFHPMICIKQAIRFLLMG